MSEQAVLDAGPLRGELRLEEISSDEIQILREDKIGDPSFEALGKNWGSTLSPAPGFLSLSSSLSSVLFLEPVYFRREA